MPLVSYYYVNIEQSKQALREVSRRWKTTTDQTKKDLKGVADELTKVAAGGKEATQAAANASSQSIKAVNKVAKGARAEIEHLRNLQKTGMIDSRSANRQIDAIRDHVRKAVNDIANMGVDVGPKLSGAMAGALESTGAGVKQNRMSRLGEMASQAGFLRTGSALSSMGAGAAAATAAVAATAASVLAAAGVLAVKGVRSAVAFEAAMAGVRKTTGLTGPALGELGSRIQSLSARLGVGQVELAGIAETAGQLGIKGTANIEAFVETVAKLGKVSDLSYEESATGIAQLLNVFGLAATEAERVGSVINELSNNTTATARDVLDAVSRVGAAGTDIGLTVDQVAAIGATLIDSGIGAERGGTALRNVFIRIRTEAEKMAEVMGVSKGEFQRMVDKDAVGGLRAYLDALRELPANVRAVKIKDTFGEEAYLAVASLVQQTDLLDSALGTAAGAFKDNTSLSNEYAAGMDNVAAQWDKFLVRLEVFGSRVVAGVLAPLGSLLESLNRIGESADETVERVAGLRGEMDNLDGFTSALATYRELSAKTSLTAEETRKLKDSVAQLQGAYPELVTGTNAAGEALGFYTEEVERTIAAEQALIRVRERESISDMADDFERASQKARQYREDQERFLEKARDERQNGGMGAERQALIYEDLARTMGELASQNESKVRSFRDALGELASTAGSFDNQAFIDTIVASGKSLEVATRQARELRQALIEAGSRLVDLNPTNTFEGQSDDQVRAIVASSRQTVERLTRELGSATEAHMRGYLADSRKRVLELIDDANAYLSRGATVSSGGGSTLTAEQLATQQRQQEATRQQAREYARLAGTTGKYREAVEAQIASERELLALRKLIADATKAGSDAGTLAALRREEQAVQSLTQTLRERAEAARGSVDTQDLDRMIALAGATEEQATHLRALHREQDELVALERQRVALADQINARIDAGDAAGADALSERYGLLGSVITQQERAIDVLEIERAKTEAMTAAAADLTAVYKDLTPEMQAYVDTLGGMSKAMAAGLSAAGVQALQSVVTATTAAADKMQRANNKLAEDVALRGLSAADAERRGREIGTAYADALREAFDSFDTSALTAKELEIYDAFKALMVSKVPTVTGQVNKDLAASAKSLGLMAQATSSIANLQSALGGVAGELAGITRGAADAMEAISRMNEARASADGLSTGQAALGYLGVASAVVGVVSSLIGYERSRAEAAQREEEQRRRMLEAIRDNTRANREVVIEMREQGVGDVSGQDVDVARTLIAMMNDFADGNFVYAGGGRDMVEGIMSYLRALEESGIDFGFDLTEMFKQLGGEDYTKALEALQKLLSGEGLEGFDGINSFLDNLEAALGRYGASVDGAIRALADWQRYFDIEGNEAIKKLVEYIGALGGDQGDLSAVLDRARALDLGTDEGRKDLQKIIQNVLARLDAGTFDLGQFTGDEIRALLASLFDISEGRSPEASSENAAFSRTITEVQASEVSDYLSDLVRETEEATVVLRDILAAIGGTTAITPDLIGGNAAAIASRVDSGAGLPSLSANQVSAAGATFYFGDLTSTVGLTEDMIRQYTERFNQELYNQLRNSRSAGGRRL